MNLTPMIETIQARLGEIIPNVLGALLILIIGWFVAIILRAVVRRGLGALDVNRRFATEGEEPLDIQGGAAKGVYYIALLFVVLAFFNALQLEIVSAPLQGLLDKLLGFVPNLAAGGILALVAWVLATVLRTGARSALGATGLDERLSQEAGMRPVSESLSQVLYWLILLLFLPAILSTLQLTGLLTPVQGMMDEALAMVPNLVAAAVIGFVGWLVARIVRDLVTNLLSAAGADRLGVSAGLRGNLTLSRLVGLLLYVFILVPAAIAALNALELEALTEPATAMLATFMAAIPNVFAAGVILAVAVFIARFVSQLATDLLGGAGFDSLPERIGVQALFTGLKPSTLVGQIIFFFAMLFAIVEAANRLGFGQVSVLVATLIEFGSQVLLGSVIIAVGFWLSNLAQAAIARTGSTGAAGLARFAILGLVLAMGLRAMGLADDIVNLAFGLTLGAVAIAVAISFGLGGREAAGRQMEHWLSRLREG